MSGTRIAADAVALALVAFVERAPGHLVQAPGESDHRDDPQDNQAHQLADGWARQNPAPRDGPPGWHGIPTPLRQKGADDVEWPSVCRLG